MSCIFFYPFLIRHCGNLKRYSTSDQLNLITLPVCIYLQSVSVHTPTCVLSSTYTQLYRYKPDKIISPVPLLNDLFFLHACMDLVLQLRKACLRYSYLSQHGQVNNYQDNGKKGENKSKGTHDLEICRSSLCKSSQPHCTFNQLNHIAVKRKKQITQLWQLTLKICVWHSHYRLTLRHVLCTVWICVCLFVNYYTNASTVR